MNEYQQFIKDNFDLPCSDKKTLCKGCAVKIISKARLLEEFVQEEIRVIHNFSKE